MMAVRCVALRCVALRCMHITLRCAVAPFPMKWQDEGTQARPLARPGQAVMGRSPIHAMMADAQRKYRYHTVSQAQIDVVR
jgi:hypothetical protein